MPTRMQLRAEIEMPVGLRVLPVLASVFCLEIARSHTVFKSDDTSAKALKVS